MIIVTEYDGLKLLGGGRGRRWHKRIVFHSRRWEDDAMEGKRQEGEEGEAGELSERKGREGGSQ